MGSRVIMVHDEVVYIPDEVVVVGIDEVALVRRVLKVYGYEPCGECGDIQHTDTMVPSAHDKTLLCAGCFTDEWRNL